MRAMWSHSGSILALEYAPEKQWLFSASGAPITSLHVAGLLTLHVSGDSTIRVRHHQSRLGRPLDSRSRSGTRGRCAPCSSSTLTVKLTLAIYTPLRGAQQPRHCTSGARTPHCNGSPSLLLFRSCLPACPPSHRIASSPAAARPRPLARLTNSSIVIRSILDGPLT